MDNSESSGASSSASTPVVTNESKESNRKELVETAVKFLTNEKVRQTSIEQQHQFLTKKGLAQSEIQEAMQRASLLLPRINAMPHRTDGYLSSSVNAAVPQSSWRDYANAAVLVGGSSYALYRLAREYILPTFFGVPSAEQERTRRLEDSVSELHNSVKFLCDSVQQMLTVLQENQQIITRIVDRNNDGSTSLNELKNDISSVKGLLLNRNQFPPPPIKSEIKIPAWQLKASEAVNGKIDSTTKHSSDSYFDAIGASSATDVQKKADLEVDDNDDEM